MPHFSPKDPQKTMKSSAISSQGCLRVEHARSPSFFDIPFPPHMSPQIRGLLRNNLAHSTPKRANEILIDIDLIIIFCKPETPDVIAATASGGTEFIKFEQFKKKNTTSAGHSRFDARPSTPPSNSHLSPSAHPSITSPAANSGRPHSHISLILLRLRRLVTGDHLAPNLRIGTSVPSTSIPPVPQPGKRLPKLSLNTSGVGGLGVGGERDTGFGGGAGEFNFERPDEGSTEGLDDYPEEAELSSSSSSDRSELSSIGSEDDSQLSLSSYTSTNSSSSKDSDHMEPYAPSSVERHARSDNVSSVNRDSHNVPKTAYFTPPHTPTQFEGNSSLISAQLTHALKSHSSFFGYNEGNGGGGRCGNGRPPESTPEDEYDRHATPRTARPESRSVSGCQTALDGTGSALTHQLSAIGFYGQDYNDDESFSQGYSFSAYLRHSVDSEGEGEDPMGFTVSTILPGSLFLGPKSTSWDHVKPLEELGVRRILNLAAECGPHDWGLGLDKPGDKKDGKQEGSASPQGSGFEKYYKIAMRDTVEEDSIGRGVRIVCAELTGFEEEELGGKSGGEDMLNIIIVKAEAQVQVLLYSPVLQRQHEKSKAKMFPVVRPDNPEGFGMVASMRKSVHARDTMSRLLPDDNNGSGSGSNSASSSDMAGNLFAGGILALGDAAQEQEPMRRVSKAGLEIGEFYRGEGKMMWGEDEEEAVEGAYKNEQEL
ncbi:hypothetical protein EV361DRAFT_982090 [Lentinula raphanica]|nr:hypothetical protein EV361DRAFT_982090 [Lentinula raphanica]